jgi:hypothetical protein
MFVEALHANLEHYTRTKSIQAVLCAVFLHRRRLGHTFIRTNGSLSSTHGGEDVEDFRHGGKDVKDFRYGGEDVKDFRYGGKDVKDFRYGGKDVKDFRF